MPCDLTTIQAAACVSGIAREQNSIKLLQLIAQLTCEAAAGVSTSTAGAAFTTDVTLTDFAAAQVGTLTNAPFAGNPTKWIAFSDNGVTRYIPTWG